VPSFVLSILAFSALLSFAGAWLLPFVFSLHRAAHVHLALAVGVMPLILGAMSHFVPVLTRSREAESAVGMMLLVVWGAGLLVFAQFAAGLFPFAASVAAGAALLACAAFSRWAWRRGKAALGSPHPCLYWYIAALVCLILALAAILAMDVWPAQRLSLKRLHLHLNTLGFIGLTALGTLQVLLPTVAGKSDTQVAQRLRSDLPYAFIGTLLIATGAAWLPWLAIAGLVLWLIPVSRLALSWHALFRTEILRANGAAPLLATALAGFACALIAGGLHGAGWRDPVAGAHLYIFAFLFPLVSGAVGHLLPLWLRPGRQTAWHQVARSRLTRGSGARALLFLLSGLLLAAGFRWGIYFALAGLAAFLPLVIWVLFSRKNISA
jgi:hypothetical protein